MTHGVYTDALQLRQENQQILEEYKHELREQVGLTTRAIKIWHLQGLGNR